MIIDRKMHRQTFVYKALGCGLSFRAENIVPDASFPFPGLALDLKRNPFVRSEEAHPSVPTLRAPMAARRRAGQERRLRRDRKIFCPLSLGKKYRTRLLIRAAGRAGCWTAWRDLIYMTPGVILVPGVP